MRMIQWVCAAAVVAAVAAPGAADEIFTIGPDGNPTDNLKIVLQDSQSFDLQLSVHFNQYHVRWAGIRWTIHSLDNTEVDVTSADTFGSLPKTSLNPLGPPSNNAVSVPFTMNWWHPNAQGTGAHAFESSVLPIGRMGVHAKNTTNLSGNSDIDLTVRAWNIFHVPGAGATSNIIQLNISDYVWASSNFIPTPGNPFPSAPRPITDPNAHWVHLDFSTAFHVPGVQGSWFYTKPFKTLLTVGIDHIPAPATTVLLAGAALAFFKGRRERRQRPA